MSKKKKRAKKNDGKKAHASDSNSNMSANKTKAEPGAASEAESNEAKTSKPKIPVATGVSRQPIALIVCGILLAAWLGYLVYVMWIVNQ